MQVSRCERHRRKIDLLEVEEEREREREMIAIDRPMDDDTCREGRKEACCM